MGNVEPRVAAENQVTLISGGQIVAKTFKQEGINHIFGWPGPAVN